MPEVRVDLQLGGIWTDVSGDVRTSSPITITRGRADEASQVPPSSCRLTLDNRAGRYSPRNPSGPYYGTLGRNVPIRVSVPGTSTYLDVSGTSAGRAESPDHASLRITGDLDVRVEVDGLWAWPTDNTWRVLMSRYDNQTGNQRSWRLTTLNNLVGLDWSADGTLSTYRSTTSWPIPLSGTGRIVLRATLDVNNGTGNTVTFFSGPSMTGPWLQLGDAVTTPGATSVHAGTAPLTVGAAPLANYPTLPVRVLRAEVRNGIDGAVVAAPDFTAQPIGGTAFTDPAGRTWTVTGPGAEITNRAIRFTGEVASWPVRRDVSGQNAYVPVQAAGVMRRLGQGQDALQSTLRRSVPTAQPLAYWPLEEERGAGQAYSPIPGVGPLSVTGFDFGSDSDLTGSVALPTLRAPSAFRGTVPAPSAVPTTWQINLLYRMPTFPTETSRLLTWTASGTVATWILDVGAISGASVHLYGLDSNGIGVTDTLEVNDGFAGPGWHQLVIRATQEGGQVTYYVQWFAVGSSVGYFMWNSYPGVLGVPREIDTQVGGLLNGTALGHIAIFGGEADVYSRADNGFEGNRPADRLTRLCAEEGVPVVVLGDVEQTAPLGPQRPATLLDLLQEAARSDLGVLADHRDSLALWYRPGYLTYNQAIALALDYTDIAGSAQLEPVDDDQQVKNDITVTRTGGSSARAVDTTSRMSVQRPPRGVGRYPDSATLSLLRDAQLPDAAGWRLHLGTWDSPRYPVVPVNLMASPHLVPAVLRTDLRDRLTISNLPPLDGPVEADLLVEGYTETIGLDTWTITYNCAPAGPWTVATLEDPALGRADTAGSQLAAAATATATTLSLTTTTGPAWTTDLTELPVDIAVGGERVRIVDMTGARGDRFERAVLGGWGTATSGQAWTTTGGSAADYSVQGG